MEKLSVKSLQIGDYINYRGQIIKVTSLYDKGGSNEVGWSDKESVWVNADNVEPIPLTPEILEKNEFVANKHVYPYPYYEYINEEDEVKIGFAYPQGNRTSYKEPWVYVDSENVFIEHLPCMFVHQLQHALRLCGIEKEIEL
jgi:hypothetical protein